MLSSGGPKVATATRSLGEHRCSRKAQRDAGQPTVLAFGGRHAVGMLVDCRSVGRIQESRDRRVGDLRLLLVAQTSSEGHRCWSSSQHPPDGFWLPRLHVEPDPPGSSTENAGRGSHLAVTARHRCCTAALSATLFSSGISGSAVARTSRSTASTAEHLTSLKAAVPDPQRVAAPMASKHLPDESCPTVSELAWCLDELPPGEITPSKPTATRNRTPVMPMTTIGGQRNWAANHARGP